MASWKSPGRAERVVIYEEEGEPLQYWRTQDADGSAIWHRESSTAVPAGSVEKMTTAELLKALEASLRERRGGARGRKFRL